MTSNVTHEYPDWDNQGRNRKKGNQLRTSHMHDFLTLLRTYTSGLTSIYSILLFSLQSSPPHHVAIYIFLLQVDRS